MPDRLSTHDVSFLYLEQPTTAMHVGTVMIFQPGPDGFDVDRLTERVAARIGHVPRYRQRIRPVPGRVANPVWVDDEHFDINYHVHRSALPRPGTDEQLAELVARLQGRPLDRRRPLWELVVVEGLSEGRFALVTKVHQALVDGLHTVDLGQVILDDSSEFPEPPQAWTPRPEPSPLELLTTAVTESVRRPGHAVGAMRSGLADVRHTTTRAARSLGGVARMAGRAAGSPASSPLSRSATEHRRFLMVTTDLEDYRLIRTRLTKDGGPLAVTINDVILACLAGALRAWLLNRGEPVKPGSTVRTLVPMSVLPADAGADAGADADGGAGADAAGADAGADASAAPDADASGAAGADAGGGGGAGASAGAGPVGSRVASVLVDLPTGEASPAMRVHQVAYQTKAHRDTGRAVDASTLAGMTGFAPPTLHSLGARLASGLSRRLFHLVVTNVPGPQHPLFFDGARMLSTYPVIPLTPGHVLSVGLTSYNGRVYYGLNADRDAMPDLDVIGQCIHDALAELVETVR